MGKKTKICLVISQYRDVSNYNDFIGKFYHFPNKYLSLLSQENIEFVYFEPSKRGEGKYFGYGKVERVFEDNRESGFYFAEISNYRSFSNPVPFKNSNNENREKPPYYNPQNAVRRIDAKVLDEICLDGGIVLNFTADAHLMSVLGEQLISSEKVGILELIKNSYDAGATYCKISIEKIPNLPALNTSGSFFYDFDGPIITIEDDGKGMDRNIIENGWLRPASTIKTNIKELMKNEKRKAQESGKLGIYNKLIENLKIEHNGRLPLGEKGVGRFATHRLGTKLEITTKTADIDYEYLLKIDWDEFDKISDDNIINLDSVGVILTRQLPTRDYGKKQSGTKIVIYGGRKGYEWSEDTIVELNQTIKNMKPPYGYGQDMNFNILFSCPQVIDLKEEESTIADDFEPNFLLHGSIDMDGVLDYKLAFDPPSSVPLPKEEISNRVDLTEYVVNEYWKQDEKPKSGAFTFTLRAWIRKPPWIHGSEYRKFTQYLEEYGGISIYRDGLLIFPADQLSRTDWLKLSTRHIKQGYRISYYNILGQIFLSQADNIELIDNSSRESILNTRPYNDLKIMMKTIIEGILEPVFMGKRDEFEKLTKGLERDPEKLQKPIQETQKVIEAINTNYDIMNDPYSLFPNWGALEERKEKLVNLSDSLKTMQKSLDMMKNIQDMLAEQAGYGLSIAIAVHEISKITANFYYGVKTIIDSGNADKIKLEDMKKSAEALKTEINRLAPQRAIRNESNVEFEIRKSIDFEYEVYRRRFAEKNISFEVIGDPSFKVFARFGVINQIIGNLLDNSQYWLGLNTIKEKKIIVSINAQYRTIIIADSGPNISDSVLPYLFEPGYSLRIPPSGLGLYICRYYMRSMKGEIYLTPEKDRIKKLDGAQFTLDFYKTKITKESN